MNSDDRNVAGAPSAFEQHSRDRLRASLDAIDGHAASRLNQARHAALAALEARHAPGGRPFRVPGIWLPAGAFTAAAVLAVAVWTLRPVATPGAALAEATPVEDAEILSSHEGPDLYADEVDFYEWAGTDAPVPSGEAG
jgi:hypothetical protein